MPRKVTVDEEALVRDYTDGGMAIYDLCDAYHIGKVKVKAILAAHGVELRKRGAQPTIGELKVDDFKERKYKERDGYHIVVYDPETDFESKDIENRGGALTTYIEKQYGVPTPTLYDRRMYYMKNGDYWWEQWLSVRYDEDKEVKRCPYCGWKTVDVENRSGYFAQHLRNEHGITPEQHLKKYPDDAGFFLKYTTSLKRAKDMERPGSSTVCPICGKRYKKLTQAHIEYLHGMKWDVFKEKYPDAVIYSEEQSEKIREAMKLGNLTVSKDRFISKYEHELQNFISGLGLEFDANRQILIGREIDIYVPSKKIGIEFDGLKFHTEFFGKKSHMYHLKKTEDCNKAGVGLIHIFEDEYVNHKDIVQSKIRHILGCDADKPRIMGRKCYVREVYSHMASEFMDMYHIQGKSKATVHIGAFHDDVLVAVMSLKNGSISGGGWELVRYATDPRYRMQGVAGKLFSYFVRTYEPHKVVSFADRRWTIDSSNNMYTKIGFTLDGVCRPDYRYYNEKVERYRRFHKFGFNKKNLAKKYGLDLSMTETEMARALGYDRIWDCGMFRYVWTKK